MKIHSTAILDPGAQIAKGVEIGPYCVIGPEVFIGQNCKIASHVVIEKNTHVGKNCRISSFAVLGGDPQDKKYKDCPSFLEIGDDNVIRENVTLHRGSKENSKTIVGHRNYLMACSHVAHDCVVGNDVVMVNGASLSGHVQVEDHVLLGGFSGIHQFVRIGQLSVIGGFAKVHMDAPPFSMVDSVPAKLYGVNTVGLKRAHFSIERIRVIRQAIKHLFMSGNNFSKAVEEIKREWAPSPDVDAIIAFARASKRGVLRGSPEEPNQTPVAESV